MKKIVLGVLAHVDSGKTTLSEALLYLSGSIKKPGRVDRGDSFFDSFALERSRGITIFSKEAVIKSGGAQLTLLDTPGHADLGAEAERTLQVLDYAVLVVSAPAGVQSHTVTLWRLLAKYRAEQAEKVGKIKEKILAGGYEKMEVREDDLVHKFFPNI